MIYETRGEAPLSRARFIVRFLQHLAVAAALAAVSLAIGIAGYMYFEGLPWLDAFMNSAMLLGGMGPVDAPKTNAGKLFAGLYALYCGLVFLVTIGVLFAPVLHRALHKFHWRRNSELPK
jgi:hypothetical protein